MMALTMTPQEFADVLRRIAAAVERLPQGQWGNRPAFNDEHELLTVAIFWKYLRSLFTATPKEVFQREEILVLLDVVSRDTELFPTAGIVKQIADLEAQDGDDDHPMLG